MTNSLFKDINVVVFIITHQDLMRIGKGRGATRIDLLGREIKELFDNKSFGLAKVELLSSLETAVDFKHPCRILTFQTQDLRSKDCEP